MRKAWVLDVLAEKAAFWDDGHSHLFGEGVGMSTVERTATRVLGFNSMEMDFQLMRALGTATYGGGAEGEIFHARRLVDDEAPERWSTAFASIGERVRALGERAKRKRHFVSAREHFLRASMYYRAAEYFADPFGEEGRRWGLASRATFIAGTRHLADRIEPVVTPFEGLELPGYFMTPAGGARNGRTLVVMTGFDGTGEELYFESGRAGLERGYNVFVTEGPGQVGTLRLHPGLVFRPDYEHPISAMLDMVLARPEVNPEALALYGMSFGGCFTLRAAAHDDRIRALILNSPIIDLHAYMAAFIGPDLASDPPPLTLAGLDSIPEADMPPVVRHAFKSSCRRFGVDSLAGYLRQLEAYTAVESVPSVRCPSLAMVGTGEGEEAMNQFERYCDAVSGPVTRRIFTVEEGADMHCQRGNLPLACSVVYDWLDELFGH